MEVFIEKYRGWDISFDTNSEGFYVESDGWDKREAKRSFASCKTFVDEYLKDNQEFKPIRIQHVSSGEEILLTGIRKDRRFPYEKKGKKEQLSDYEEKYYIIFDADNIPKFHEAKRLDDEASVLRIQAHELRESITGKKLSDFKKENYPSILL